MPLAKLASLQVNWTLCSHPKYNSRPILVQRCTDKTSCPVVRPCSAAGRGVGVGQEGSQSSSVQQVADKAQKSCKTGSPRQGVCGSQRAGTEVCGWEGVEASNTENHTRAQLRKGREGVLPLRKPHGWGSPWRGGFAWIPNGGEKLPGMYLVPGMYLLFLL